MESTLIGGSGVYLLLANYLVPVRPQLADAGNAAGGR